jgi:hypothetical protein
MRKFKTVPPGFAPPDAPDESTPAQPAKINRASWERAVQKIHNVMGEDKGQKLIDETMRSVRLSRVTTVDDLLKFGEALVVQGGVIEAIGRSIKIQAVLHGALAR